LFNNKSLLRSFARNVKRVCRPPMRVCVCVCVCVRVRALVELRVRTCTTATPVKKSVLTWCDLCARAHTHTHLPPQNISGVPNVFTQHEPLVGSIVQQLQRNKLSKTMFPFMGPELTGPMSNIIVFIVGGATYEEACKVASLNASGSGAHVILGGTATHNSGR